MQQWSGTGLFLVGVKLWPGLKAAAIRSPPEGGDGLGPLLNLHLLGELHFRYIVQAFLHVAERSTDVTFKLTLSDQTLFVPSFEGDLDSWTMPNGEELLIHMVRHMDGTEGNTFCLHLQDYWNVCSIMHSQHFRRNSLAVSLPLFYININLVSFPCALNPKLQMPQTSLQMTFGLESNASIVTLSSNHTMPDQTACPRLSLAWISDFTVATGGLTCLQIQLHPKFT